MGGRAGTGWENQCPGDVTASPAAPGLGRSQGSGNAAHTETRKTGNTKPALAAHPGGCTPAPRTPKPPGLGEQSQPLPTRLRPDKLIAQAAIGKGLWRRALKGCPVLAPWATAGDNAGTALGCQPTAPRAGPILHPRAQRCQGGCGVLVARGQLAGAGTVSSATLNY